jgi:hypothetical protein
VIGVIGVIDVIGVIAFCKGPPFFFERKKYWRKKITYIILWLMWSVWWVWFSFD